MNAEALAVSPPLDADETGGREASIDLETIAHELRNVRELAYIAAGHPETGRAAKAVFWIIHDLMEDLSWRVDRADERFTEDRRRNKAGVEQE